MSVLLRKKYSSIKKEKLSEQAKSVLKSMYDTTNGFKDVKVTRKIKPKFEAFYNKLKESKPEAIVGGKAKSKAAPEKSADDFKAARQRRKPQTGVPKDKNAVEKDAVRPAINIKGKRTSKAGNTYYEYRDNRFDKNPSKYPMLAKGGEMAKGGGLGFNQYGEPYGYEESESDSVYEIHHKPEMNANNPYLIWDKIDGVYIAEFPNNQRALHFIENKKYGYAKGGEMPNSQNLFSLMKLDSKNGHGMLIDGKVYTKKEADLKKDAYEEEIFYNANTEDDMDMEVKIFSVYELLSRKSLPKTTKAKLFLSLQDKQKEIESLTERFADDKYDWKKDYADGGMMAKGGYMADGGELASGFLIDEMKQYLNDKFPYSFGFKVYPIKQGTTFTPDYEASILKGRSLNGLNSKDLDYKKLMFPKYKKLHDINYEVTQGGENTYFEFLLSDTDGDKYYSGTFGFKDQGDVSPDYITKFIAFLMESYGLPFKVNHSVYAKGGYMADGGKIKTLIGKEFRPFPATSSNEYNVEIVDIDFDNVTYKHKDGEVKKAKTSDFIDSYIQVKEKGGMTAYRGEVNTFNYRMLDRLRSDNDYYLGNGNRHEKHLWAGNVDGQIAEMKKLWNELPKDKKPEWLSMDDIENYERKMKGNKMAEGGMMEKGGEAHRLDSIFEDGGEIAEGNLEMAMSNVKAIGHHAQELKSLLNEDTSIEAWVVAKLERAETDLSDVTHYVDGLKGEEVESDTYFAKGGELNDKPINFPTKNQTEESAKKWLNELIKEKGRKEAAKIVRYNLEGKNPYYRYNNTYDTWLSSATLNQEYAKGGYMADGGGVGRTVMIPTYVVKEINDSVKMGYDTIVEGMIGRKRKGVMLINDKYEVRGTYDIGLKDAIQNIIDKIKSGTFKVDAVDSKAEDGYMAKGGSVGKIYYHILEYGDYGNIGYQGYYETEQEAKKEINRLSGYFPNMYYEIFTSDSMQEPPVTTMSKGGETNYLKKWRVKGIDMQGRMFKKEITLGRMSDKNDVMYALKRMPDNNIREVTLIEEIKEDGGMMAKGGRLSRKQKQLDLNKNGKLDSQDFKMLRAGRKNARKK